MKKISFLYVLLIGNLIAHEENLHSKPKDPSKTILNIKSHDYVTTGNGKFTYNVSTTWGNLPNNEHLGRTHGGVVVDSKNHVYISTDNKNGILVFKENGEFVASLGEHLSHIHQLAINKEGDQEFIYGAKLAGENASSLVKLDLAGNIIFSIPNNNTSDIKPEDFKGITGVTVAPDNSIFVSTGYGTKHIYKISQEGQLIKKFGGKINKEKPYLGLSNPHGIAIDSRFEQPRLLVADREKRRLVHYDLDGNYIGIYATNLRRPCAISFFGEYCAVAELESRVTILDKKGVPIAFLGDNPNQKQWANFRVPLEEQKHGIFSAPHGLSFNKAGDLYVQDWNIHGRATKLSLVKP